MQHEFTAREVAKRLHCHASTVTLRANEFGIGRQNDERLWFFTNSDVRRLRGLIRDGRGRPKKGRGK